jgi:hypothetical protein
VIEYSKCKLRVPTLVAKTSKTNLVRMEQRETTLKVLWTNLKLRWETLKAF